MSIELRGKVRRGIEVPKHKIRMICNENYV